MLTERLKPQNSLVRGIHSVAAFKKTFRYGDHTVTLETGVIARQATAAVLVSMDDTVVLVTVVAKRSPKIQTGIFSLLQ